MSEGNVGKAVAIAPGMAHLEVGGNTYSYYPISHLPGSEMLPFSLKVLLENVLRNSKGQEEAAIMASRIIDAAQSGSTGEEVEFSPARVLFQDFTGVPVFVDFAVMREACKDLGGNPKRINPQIPCDLVIDHSVIADYAGMPDCLERNEELEFERNSERYEFLKWAQGSFENVRIVPSGQGICHQLNIEQFASVVMVSPSKHSDDAIEAPLVYFDTVVGTDSHTPTVNGIGVLGWGVGGIEAEAAALGQPITTLVPKVVGIELSGKLAPGVAAMDVSLALAEKLRMEGVVGCFAECFGEGVGELSPTQRACISNMTPEYGCTCTLFPVDRRTLDFLRMTGREDAQIELVEAYAKKQGFWLDESIDHGVRRYSQVIKLDLSSIAPSMAGPSRPHERFDLSSAGSSFADICEGRGLSSEDAACVSIMGEEHELHNGAIAIAAVTSCTTATDPAMMLQAGLLARNADRAGLRPKPWVKTIFAPGSHSVQVLLEKAGLAPHLERLGFFTCGYGCMSCIGNSGPLSEQMRRASKAIELSSVLSGNRNFEGRISPDVAQNYLTTPAHVIAYALAGSMAYDPKSDPLGYGDDGNPVYLSDIEPCQTELDELLENCIGKELYKDDGSQLYEGSARWRELRCEPSDTFTWEEGSSYVRRPPYFDGMTLSPVKASPIEDAVALAVLGDFITTDHISPAGAIAPDSPAGEYLRGRGVSVRDFNTYGSRRGNHEVMMRGTLANVKLKNGLAEGKMGGHTLNFLADRISTIFEAAEDYINAGVPSIILAGKMYGSGSSRDWAAKGPMLIGIKAVIAESFERIHRSNLIGTGILPLQFIDGENANVLGLDGTERYTVSNVTFSDGMPEDELAYVTATRKDGSTVDFKVLVRIDTPTEGKYFENGGILQYVLRELV